MAIIIHDTTVATVDDQDRVLHDAAVVIDAGRIAATGSSADLLEKFPDAERISGRHKFVMPGMANTHTHLSKTAVRGVFEDLSPPNTPPFPVGGGLSDVPEPGLTPDEKRVMCQLGALEALRSGTTLILEDAIDIPHYAQAMADTGMRFVLAERVWDKANGSVGDAGDFDVDASLMDKGVERARRLYESWHGAADGRIQAAIAAWAPDMCSPACLAAIKGVQDEFDILATVHLNQIWGEVDAVKRHRNCLPTEYLEREGFLGPRLVAAHCRCMDPREDEILGRAGVSIAFNSAIAARRGLSPHIKEMEAAGATITLGSDNMSEDMIEVMRTALFMERVRNNDGRTPTPEQVLRWATIGGYRALGVPEGGSLVVGNKADLIMIDLKKPHLTPALRAVSTFVHQGQVGDVDAVMVDGRFLMRDGVVLTMDEAAIMEEANTISHRAWNRMLSAKPEYWAKLPPGFHLDDACF
jgi:5-methylthioadenosine/S-adenosylhomocysteine deaminase